MLYVCFCFIMQSQKKFKQRKCIVYSLKEMFTSRSFKIITLLQLEAIQECYRKKVSEKNLEIKMLVKKSQFSKDLGQIVTGKKSWFYIAGIFFLK